MNSKRIDSMVLPLRATLTAFIMGRLFGKEILPMEVEQDFFSSGEQEATHSLHFSFALHYQANYFRIEGGLHMQQQTTMVPARASRTSCPKANTEKLPLYDDEHEYDDMIIRTPTSARRYSTPRSAQASSPTTQQQATQALPSPVRNWRAIKRSILKVLLVVLLLVLVADTLGYAAWKHWQYGDYPTSHTSTNFGHGGTSDLIAFTSGQEVEIIEFVGMKANMYAAKMKNASGHHLVMLDVLDVNGDGKPDLLVDIDGVAQRSCLLNTGNAFEWSVTR
jgi:hypothetical protein